MKRRAIHLGLIGAFVFAIVLSVSPQLHERVHSDATQSQHACAVTLIGSGNYHHAGPPSLLQWSLGLPEFRYFAFLNAVWVASPFSKACIFAHAPPTTS